MPSHYNVIFALIHDLGLSEDQYRAVYEGVTGKQSLRLMTATQRERVIFRLKEIQKGIVNPSYKGVAMCKLPHARKIRSLWLELKGLGELRDSSEAALLSFVEKLTGETDMADLNGYQSNDVIEALKKWLARVEEAHEADLAVVQPGAA